MMRWLAHLCVLFGALSGCGGVLSQVTADREDYWEYRQIRTAPSIDRRLRAAMQYLRDRPTGRWHSEVRRWFDVTESEYFESLANDSAGMRRYLDALPDGPHADAAADRAAQLDRARELAQQREVSEMAGVYAIEARLDRAAKARAALVDTFSEWTRRTASITSWGGRTSELDHEFIYRYRLTAPEAHCDTWHCAKALSLDYAIPDGTALVPRRALFDVALRLEKGGVVSASVSGPDLFTRVGEALLLRPIAPDDVSARLEAMGRVADLVAVSVESALPASRCSKAPTSPVVVERWCGRVRMRMIAAATPEEDDRIVVEALRER